MYLHRVESRTEFKGYFLCADILGFRQIVENQQALELSDRLAKWIDAVLELSEKYAFCRIQHFSDTIFVSTDSSEEELGLLLEFSRSLLERGIEHSFPIRGGIAHGTVVWDDAITFGQAVIEAHKVEKESDWIGIACSSTCCHTESLASWDLLVKYPVPRRNGPVETSSVVAWSVPSVSKLIQSTTSGLPKHSATQSHDHHTKAANTLLFGKYLKHGCRKGYDPRRFSFCSPLHFLDTL